MKKLLAVLSLVIMLIGVAGCGNNDIEKKLAQIDDLLADIEKLTNENNNLKDQLQDLDALIVELEIKAKELQDQNAELEEIANNIIDQNKELSNKVQELFTKTAGLETKAEEINSIRDLINQLTAKLTEAEGNTEQLVSEIQSLYATLANLEKDLNTLQENLAKAEVESSTFVFPFQIDDTLASVITYRLPKQVLANGAKLISTTIEIHHPLRATANLPTLVKTYEVTDGKPFKHYFDYHGAYQVIIKNTYQKDAETVTYQASKEIHVSAKHYNIAWLNATMPLLLFAADMFTGVYDEGYTYVEIERAKTYNFAYLPENTYHFPAYASASKGNYDQTQVPAFYDPVTRADDMGQALAWIEELYSMDVESTFTFACVDNTAFVWAAFLTMEIPTANMNFKVYTDGSFTSSNIRDYYENINNFNYFLNSYLSWREMVENGDTYPAQNYVAFTLVATTNDDFEYIVNNTVSWGFTGELAEKLTTLNVRVLSVADAFKAVDDAKKMDELEYLLNTRWGDSETDSMYAYFSASPKKNLLILGTSPSGEGNANYASFEKYIEWICDNLGDEYDLFYKGHPRYPSNDDRKALFAEKGIIELNNSIPVETLMLLYSDVYIGGYHGTSMQSSLEGQTIFFFGPINMVKGNASLREMIETSNIFANTIYLIKDQAGNVIVQSLD